MSKIEFSADFIGIECFSTDLERLGGTIKKTPESFIVREILPNGKILTNSPYTKEVGGLFTHCILEKVDLDTLTAVEILSHHFNCQINDFEYAGLKDSKAHTFQRLSIWKIDPDSIKAFNHPQIKLHHPTRQLHTINLGELKGNHFEIVVTALETRPTSDNIAHIKKVFDNTYFLNYFGSQRFGSQRPILHLIGKYLLQGEYQQLIDTYIGHISNLESDKIIGIRKDYQEGEAPSKIIERFPNKFSYEKMILRGLIKGWSLQRIIFSLPNDFLRLAISSFQSYIFNRLLSYAKKENLLENYTRLPIPGYLTPKEKNISDVLSQKVQDLLAKEGITYRDFYQQNKRIRSKGVLRRATLKIDNFNISSLQDGIKTEFSLPPGAYATIIIRELTGKLFY